MHLADRLADLATLGTYLLSGDAAIEEHIALAERYNPWFTAENSRLAIRSIAEQWLNSEALQDWAAAYPALVQKREPRKIGLVLAGNLPAVGFHDVLAVLFAGHKLQIKLSNKDKILIPFFLQKLIEIRSDWSEYIEYTEKLKGMQAIIATGNDSSALHFQQYFSNWPHIIRANRNSVAILRGGESEEQLLGLSRDIFRYFGLGCRSVSMLYVPEGYDFSPLLAYLDRYADIMQHSKYCNNYDYNRSLYLLNKVQHLANDCIMVLEHESPLSRIGTLHYSFYKSEEELRQKLSEQANYLQCIVAPKDFAPMQGLRLVDFGQSQEPSLFDYADGQDTLAFLLSLA